MLGGVNKNWTGAAAGCIIFIIASTSAASAQTPELLDFGTGRPIPPGDVSVDQNMFRAVCWACHGLDLSGAKGPPLTGPTFCENWQGRRADALSDLIGNTMPQDEPGLSEREAPQFHSATRLKGPGGLERNQRLAAFAPQRQMHAFQAVPER